MKPTISKYGCDWPSDADPVDIEIACLKRDGWWKDRNGKPCGLGKFEHFRRLDKLLWPKLKEHRWHTLILKHLCESRIVALLGPKNSCKTNSMGRWAILNWLVFAGEITILVSSTDLRGLQLRVWGEIIKLWKAAKKVYPAMPGHVLDAKIMITYENVDDESRDLRNGIIGIPCVVNGTFVGLSKVVGIKNQRMMLIGDECFVAGTLVDTPNGAKPIESIQPGDVILNAVGTDTVLGVRQSYSKSLVRIKTQDGRVVACTSSHGFLTQYGYVKAIDINCSHYMISTYEAMRILQTNVSTTKGKLQELRSLPIQEGRMRMVQNSIPSASCQISESFLLSELRSKMENPHSWTKRKDARSRTTKTKKHREIEVASRSSRICGQSVDCDDTEESHEGNNSSTLFVNAKTKSWGKWTWPNDGGNPSHEYAASAFSNSEHADCYQTGRRRISHALQNRCGDPWDQVGGRSRRIESFRRKEKKERFEERCFLDGTWVESVEILKPHDFETAPSSPFGVAVYNLHVEKHHSYSVNGLHVLNCQFMQQSFVNSISNLDGNPIFQAVVAGNPSDAADSLGTIAEPARELGGWPGVEHFEKTTVWKTRFSRGTCINLDGRDSPNMDVPEDQPVPFPFLITRQKIADTINDFGEDSFEYWSQCVGKMPKAGLLRRVITHQMVAQFHANDEPIWGSDEFTKIFGLDAAYGGVGGDRCILIELWLGKGMDKKPLLWMCGKPMNVPIKFLDERIPEDQIADFVLSKASERGVDTSNIFYDSTGRGSLGSAFARAGSSSVVPVEFGGRASDRNVSSQIKVPCHDYYFNCMSEMWYTWRYAIEADQFRGLHKEVEDEGCLREWKKVAGNKIQVEPKEKTKERAGRSPDLADALVCGIEGARRRGFVIGTLGGGSYSSQALRWLKDMRDDSRNLIKSYQLR